MARLALLMISSFLVIIAPLTWAAETEGNVKKHKELSKDR